MCHMVPENTDVLHEPGTDPDWSESFYFNFYDRKNGILAFMRIGITPNKGKKNFFCGLIMPDGEFLVNKSELPLLGEPLEAGLLRFERIIPERLWSLSFDGPLFRTGPDSLEGRAKRVQFKVLFESLNKIFDYRECVSGHKEIVSGRVASEHLEQFGRATGSMILGDSVFEISALGERDHSWGVRDWNAPKMWIWLTCQFSEEHALNVTKLVMGDEEVDAGFVHINGRNVRLISAKIETKYSEDGSPASLKMLLKDGEGRLHDISATVEKMATLPFRSEDGKHLSLLYEPLARYEQGKEAGYGVAEYLVKKF